MANYKQAPRCNHIMDSGHACGSPALKGHTFCYNHRRAHTPVFDPKSSEAFIPYLESGEAIGIAVTNILRAVGAGRLDPKQGYCMFYGIQQLNMMFKHRVEPNEYLMPNEVSPVMEAVLETNYSDPKQAFVVARELYRPRPDCGVGTSVRESILEEMKEEKAAEACHAEPGRESEVKHPDSAGTTDAVPGNFNHEISVQETTTADACHAERGRESEGKHPDAAGTTDAAPGNSHEDLKPLTTAEIDRLALLMGMQDSHTREQIQESWQFLAEVRPESAKAIRKKMWDPFPVKPIALESQ